MAPHACSSSERKAAVSQSLPAPKKGKGPAVVLPPAPQAAAPAKLTRINWSKGENLAKLTLAVEEWKSGSGRAAPREHLGDPEPRKPSLGEFAALVEIPKGTLANYVTSTQGMARSLGASSGQQPHLSNDDRLFVAENLRRADRGNDGMTKQKAMDIVQDIKPTLSRSQAENALRSVRHEHAPDLTGIVKAQATTTKRSAITVTKQFRWHSLFDCVLEELRTHNTGPTNRQQHHKTARITRRSRAHHHSPIAPTSATGSHPLIKHHVARHGMASLPSSAA